MLRYVELSSQYRNRKIDPLPSDFTIEVFSNNNQERSVDPVCETAPLLYWQNSFNETQNLDYVNINTIDVTYNTSDTTIIDVTAPENNLRKLDNFYNGAVLAINDGTVIPNYITDGLVLNLDARITGSYPGTGSLWYDTSGNGLVATLVNNPTFINNREGFLFESPKSQYATIPDSPVLNPPVSFSIEVYVKCIQKTELGSIQTILEKALPPTIQYAINIIGLPPVGNVAQLFQFSVNNVINTCDALFNEWVRIGLTYNSISGTFTVYINNNIFYFNNITVIPVTNNPIILATDSTLTNYWSGNILVVRMYDRELDEVEMLQNYYNLINSTKQYIRRRILRYKYLTPTTAEIVLYPPPLPDGLVVIDAVIERPSSDTTMDVVPRFFIPRGVDIENYYVNKYLQNLDFGEARLITGYDAITHMVKLESNTIANWLSKYEWSWEGGSNILNNNLPSEPQPRRNALVWIDFRNRLWLYGGEVTNYVGPPTPGPPTPNDLWRLNENMTWTNIIPPNGNFGGYYQDPIYPPVPGTGDATTTPGSREQANTWVDLQGNFWLYAGRLGGVGYGDLWKYDGTYWIYIGGPQYANPVSNYGIQGVPSPTNTPGSRNGSVVWVDFEGIVWLYGGAGYDNFVVPGALSDLWKWDGQYWTWMYGSDLANQPSVYAGPNATPGGRGEFAGYTTYWYVNSTNTLWIYGGPLLNAPANYTEDVWKWDGTKWTFVFGRQLLNLYPIYNIKGIENSTNNPGARVSCAKWVDTQGNLWVFGGALNEPPYFWTFNDMWKFDTTTQRWTWISGPNTYVDPAVGNYGDLGEASLYTLPPLRSGAASWTDIYGNLWLYSGIFGGGYTDIWKFRPSFGNFTIRSELPINYGQIIGVNGYTITLQNALYPTNYYINAYVRIIGNRPNSTLGYSIDPPPYAEMRRIIQFNSATLTATLENLFSVSPLGLWYELLPYTRDNYQVIVYPYAHEENAVHDVKLTSLRIPNQKLLNGNGKTVLDFPYLYINIKNSNIGHTLVYSNNPNATNTTFCVTTSNLVYTNGPFIVVTYTDMVQRAQIDPRYNLELTVLLPDGSPLQFELQDNVSPLPTNPLLQISALFEFKKVFFSD